MNVSRAKQRVGSSLSFLCRKNVLHKFNFITFQCMLAYCSTIIIVHVYRSVEKSNALKYHIYEYTCPHVYTYTYVICARTVKSRTKFT